MNEMALERSTTLMDGVDEAMWLPAAQRGEAWAIDRLYTGHHRSVYALCRRLLSRAEDAEDAMQLTFVQAIRGLQRFRGNCTARTWLYRIAVNTCMDQLRRRPSIPLPLDIEIPASDGAPAVAERMAVQTALDALRPDHRTILVLRFWEDLSYEEIAGVLGLSMPAVKMRLNRAKTEFSKVYQEGAE